jgi:hypothetical protein
MKVTLIFVYGFVIGGICFLIGFIGPIIVTPEANQGPLLGIFITGPLGFVFGILVGLFYFFKRERNPDFRDPLQRLIDRF